MAAALPGYPDIGNCISGLGSFLYYGTDVV